MYDKCPLVGRQEFLAGFWEVVPAALLTECQIDEKDLGMLVSGVAEVDVADWRAHTTAQPAESPTIGWFWETVERLGVEQRARILQFSTGLSRLPPEGFKGLRPPFELVQGIQTCLKGHRIEGPSHSNMFEEMMKPSACLVSS